MRLQQLAARASTEAPHTLLESGLAKRRMSILQVLQIESHQLAPQLRHHRRWRQTQSRPQRAWFDRRRQPDKADDSLLFPHPCNESFSKTGVRRRRLWELSVQSLRRWRRVGYRTHAECAESIIWLRSRYQNPKQKWRSQLPGRGVDFAESIFSLARLAESIFKDVMNLKF